MVMSFYIDDKGACCCEVKGYRVSWYNPEKGRYKVVKCPSGRYAGSSGFFSAALHVILEGIMDGSFDVLAR